MRLSLLCEISNQYAYNIRISMALPIDFGPKDIGTVTSIIHKAIIRKYGKYLDKVNRMDYPWYPKTLKTHKLFIKDYRLKTPIEVENRQLVGRRIIFDIKTIPPNHTR